MKFELAPEGQARGEKFLEGFAVSEGCPSAAQFRSLGAKSFPYTGSPALINENHHGVNYLALRLEIPADPDSAVTFVATRPDSSTVSATFNPERLNGPQAFAFNGDFRGVAAVRWIANGYQFDDIRLRRRRQ